MSRSISLILALSLILTLTVWISLVRCPEAAHGQDGGDLADQNDMDTVMIALTKLDVNDQNLKLSYEIRNDSNHDIWICEDLNDDNSDSEPYEVFFAKDGQTLVIRRRLDVEAEIEMYIPITSRYVRLRPGENWIESISLLLPVQHILGYASPRREKGLYATQLVIEIGYYTGDLPGMVRDILDVAEKLDWQRFDQYGCDPDILRNYFSGMRIAAHFGGLSIFYETNNDLSKEIRIPYTERLLKGEQILRITAGDVLIPYSGEII